MLVRVIIYNGLPMIGERVGILAALAKDQPDAQIRPDVGPKRIADLPAQCKISSSATAVLINQPMARFVVGPKGVSKAPAACGLFTE